MHFHTLFLISGVQWAQLFVTLSALIILHEGGHFFFAKLFKTRVEKFYLFFDFLFPFAGLLNFSIFKKKVGDTEYGIGWFPLGGYVKIAGMVDESMDKAELAKPPQPWEYRSKPAWQRLCIMLGGIIVNMVTAMIIYMVVFGVWGEKSLPAANAKWGIVTDAVARNLGFKDGDRVLSIDHKPVDDISDIKRNILLQSARTAQVMRDGQPVDITFPADVLGLFKGEDSVSPRIPIVVKDVVAGGNAQAMGMRPGDSVVAVNGKPVQFMNDFQATLAMLKNQPVSITVIRPGGGSGILNGKVTDDGKIGVQIVYDADRYFVTEKIHYSPIAAVGKGFTYTFQQFGTYYHSLKLMITSKHIKDNIGGIGSFAKAAPDTFHPESFLLFTALVSVILAFMNLLPIPGLDGGYVIFLLWELITRRKVSDKVMEVATTIGLVLLLALMLYANGMDIFKGFIKK